MDNIPFLKPSIVKLDSYKGLLQEIDESSIYSNFGPLNNRFESRIINEIFQNEGYCTTVNNCTSGLILAINAIKRKKAKYAIMPSFTFSATAQAAMWCGLEPYFIDIDKDGWSIDNQKLLDTIDKLGDEIAVIIPYATFANNINLKVYTDLQNKGFPVVIDAAPGLGSRYNEIAFAKGFEGATVFSLHATKGFGIGEGGLVYSANKDTIKIIRKTSNFGFSSPGDAESLGLNAKMSEYAAAIALATLDVFDKKVAKRIEIKTMYLNDLESSGLLDKGWRIQKTCGEIPLQFFSLLLPTKSQLNKLSAFMEKNGISTRHYFSPSCHQQKCFKHYSCSDLNITEDVASRIISLPLWEEMTSHHIDHIINTTLLFDKKLLS